MSVPMELVDFIPVVLFIISSITLQRCLYDRMGKGAFAVFSAGTVMVCCAGIFKAVWKLLYSMGICDFERLNQAFFPLQSIGFLLAGIAVTGMVFFKQNRGGKKALPDCRGPGLQRYGHLHHLHYSGFSGSLRRFGGRRKTPRKHPLLRLLHSGIRFPADDGLSRYKGLHENIDELDLRMREPLRTALLPARIKGTGKALTAGPGKIYRWFWHKTCYDIHNIKILFNDRINGIIFSSK